MTTAELLAQDTLNLTLHRPTNRARARNPLEAVLASPVPDRVRDIWVRTLRAARAAASVCFPPSVAVFWTMVVGVDFLNDWIIEGVTTTFRPAASAMLDLAVWWTPWVLAAPLLSIPIRRLDPARIGWGRSLAGHAPLMLTATALHALLAAWVFTQIGGGSVVDRFEHFARAFTLSEALLYGGLVVAYRVGWARANGSDGDRARQIDAAAKSNGWIRRFAVRDGDVTRFVPVDDVSHVEAAGNYVRLHVSGGEHLVRATLSGVEERLDPGRFRRVHRSTIVNVDRVARIDAWFNGDCLVTLDDGRELRVSRTYRSNLVDPLV